MAVEPSESAAFFVEQEGNPPQVVVAVIGEIDLANRPELESCLKEARADDVAAVELDLSAVTFIDVSGLKPILEFQQDCEDRGIEFRMWSSPAVDRVLELLDDLGEAAQLLLEDD